MERQTHLRIQKRILKPVTISRNDSNHISHPRAVLNSKTVCSCHNTRSCVVNGFSKSLRLGNPEPHSTSHRHQRRNNTTLSDSPSLLQLVVAVVFVCPPAGLSISAVINSWSRFCSHSVFVPVSPSVRLSSI